MARKFEEKNDTYNSVLTYDDGLPAISLTCYDLDGGIIGEVAFQEHEVAENLGYEPNYHMDNDEGIALIHVLENWIFG
ncbi:hypothetical protein KKH23_04240 [Patescibacteria group bacterium]|nr:hypothetical protein [Patescibacteria group bacterium]